MGWEEQSPSGLQDEPGQDRKGTGSVMVTSWKARPAVLVVESLLKAREGECTAGKEGDDFQRP